jgi:aldose sugar dehydrogenase
MYFEGWMTGDTTKIGRAMHTTCHLKYFRDGKFSDINRKDYLSLFTPKPKDAGTHREIERIDITQNIASVRALIYTATHKFTDYFNLIKIDGLWYIVDKVSERE